MVTIGEDLPSLFLVLYVQVVLEKTQDALSWIAIATLLSSRAEELPSSFSSSFCCCWC